jgi:excisionase family DNA binding protein
MIFMTEEKVLYSIKEAAQILGLSDDTIRRMIKAGELEAQLIRGRWKIKKTSMDKYTK